MSYQQKLKRNGEHAIYEICKRKKNLKISTRRIIEIERQGKQKNV